MYLIARMHVLFLKAPTVLSLVAIIGAATLLLAGFSAITQHDIKRILAYSTISQIGYMFLALGVGAWAAAIYHFATHAFFKSALFLGAGVLIKALGGEHDIFRMGGLRRRLPGMFWAFLAAMTLAAVPPLTLTFSSKDLILNQVWLSGEWGSVLWILGLVGAFLTAVYAFRMLFVVFFGPERAKPIGEPSLWMVVPFAALVLAGGLAGFPELLDAVFGAKGFYRYLHSAMSGPIREFDSRGAMWVFHAIYVTASLIGIGLAYLLYERAPALVCSAVSTFVGRQVHRLLFAGWGFDWLYRRLIVAPYVWLARLNRGDVVDLLYIAVARVSRGINMFLSLTVNGNVRWYVASIVAGAVIVVGLVVFL